MIVCTKEGRPNGDINDTKEMLLWGVLILTPYKECPLGKSNEEHTIGEAPRDRGDGEEKE